MYRTLQPELLDSLGPAEPAAQHSRRDLKRINRVMRNAAWIRRQAPRVIAPHDHVLEIGAGTGNLCRALHQQLPHCDALDLWPKPAGWPPGNRWHQADIFRFHEWPRYRAIIGNLIFHQFTDAQLEALGAAFRSTARVIIACEPARHRIFQSLFRVLCPLIGANYVTRHDGHVSIAAGFRGDELPGLLGLDAGEWTWRTQTTALGAYRLIAIRR